MKKPQILLLLLLICTLSLILSSLPDQIVPRLINDPYDISNYKDRGSWIVLGKQPYGEVFSEYPQLATYMFAIPHLVENLIPADIDIYQYTFSFMMAVCLAITIVLLYQIRSERKYLAFLMFLPASLYFTHNRYDIVPVLFTVMSVALLLRGRFQLASFTLAVSVMFKWYPVVLLPVFLAYSYSTDKRLDWRMILTFGLTVGLIALPTLLLVGLDGFLVPYLFHLGRGVNRESIVFLVEVFMISAGFFTPPVKFVVYNLFLLLQVGLPFSAFLLKVRGKSNLLAWSTAAILSFMLFAKYYSPQWLLWILPFLILRAATRRDVVMIIVFDLFTYLKFPLVYDLADQTRFGMFDILIYINLLLLIYFAYGAYSEIIKNSDFVLRLPWKAESLNP